MEVRECNDCPDSDIILKGREKKKCQLKWRPVFFSHSVATCRRKCCMQNCSRGDGKLESADGGKCFSTSENRKCYKKKAYRRSWKRMKLILLIALSMIIPV